jgi:hypothetical protein
MSMTSTSSNVVASRKYPQPSCRKVYEQLFTHSDWIGTTETIDSVTLPLLERFLMDPYYHIYASTSPGGTKQKEDYYRSRNPSSSFRHHEHVGTYLRVVDGPTSESSRIDPKLQEWIQQEGSCENYAIWKQANASIAKILLIGEVAG